MVQMIPIILVVTITGWGVHLVSTRSIPTSVHPEFRVEGCGDEGPGWYLGLGFRVDG